MTYRELVELKFGQGISTYELWRKFPEEVRRVSEVALLELPEAKLKEIIREERALLRLLTLKRKFALFF